MDELVAIITNAQRGDRDAFDTLVCRFQRMAIATAYASVHDPHLAEDVAQEAFLQAWSDLPTLRDPAAFPGWFRRIVFKHGDRLTRAKRLPLSPLEDAMGIPCPDREPPAVAERRAVQRRVWAEVALLAEHQRIVVTLYYLGGYPQRDIAAFLDIPVSTVKKRLHDARARLAAGMLDLLRDGAPTHASRHDDLARRVRFLLAICAGDASAVALLLAQDRTLATAAVTTEDWRRSDIGTQHALPMRCGATPLHLAATYGHTALIDPLLTCGAEIDAESPGGTPLHRAVIGKDAVMVGLLVRRGADLNAVTTPGMTPLERAVILGQREIATILLGNGAEADTADNAGRTPLHWAALHGDGDLTALLLAHGAATDRRDMVGRTPASWADVRGHTAVVNILRRHAAMTNGLPAPRTAGREARDKEANHG